MNKRKICIITFICSMYLIVVTLSTKTLIEYINRTMYKKPAPITYNTDIFEYIGKVPEYVADYVNYITAPDSITMLMVTLCFFTIMLIMLAAVTKVVMFISYPES